MTAPEVASAVTAAVHSGDLGTLRQLVEEHPRLASSGLGGAAGGRTPLHVVTDWPGFFPKGPEAAQLFIDAGADVDAHGDDENGETPLHWAASSDDAAVAAVLIDAGANINMPHGSIGAPLANAVGYGCWNVARLLVARGATVDGLWEAAALGLLVANWRNCWRTRPSPRRRTSPGPSGTPVPVASDGRPSGCSTSAPTSTGCPSTPTGHR